MFLVKAYLVWKDFYSRLTDRSYEHLEESLVPKLFTPQAVWEYIRKYVPYTGNPGLPYLEAQTTGFFDRYIHPLRLLKWAQRNKSYVTNGYQYTWPYHVAPDCDAISLLAVHLINKIPGHKAELLTLVTDLTHIKYCHVVCMATDPEGKIYSVDPFRINAHKNEEALVGFFEKEIGVKYTVVRTPLPFGLQS